MQITLNDAVLVPVIIGLTQFAKEFGITGKWSRLFGLVLGLVLGIFYKISQAVPASLGEWLFCVIYGLALGMTASGIYDFGRQLADESSVKLIRDESDDEADVQ